jgi:hypothetical protein
MMNRNRDREMGSRRSNSGSMSRVPAKFYDVEGASLDEIEPFKLNAMSDAALMNAFYNLLNSSFIDNMLKDMKEHTIASFSAIDDNLQKTGEKLLAFFPF